LFGSALSTILAPLLRDPAGRLVAVCLALAIAAVLAVHLLRDRFRALRSGLLLRHHLEAMAHWLHGDARRARGLWRAVARSRAPLPAESRHVREHACLALARLALEAGDPGEATACVLRVHADALPDELRRLHAQLRARALVAMPESLPESTRRELELLVQRWPDDLVLLRLLRDRLAADGEHQHAAEVQERIWRAAEPAAAAQERDRLAQAWLAAAADRLAHDALDEAEAALAKAAGVDPQAAAASPLGGELRHRRGDLRGALRAWARVPGGAGIARAAAALDDCPEPPTPREILECTGTEGGLLLAARAFARAGDRRRA